jgi:superfamily II DNA or RNA helicase
VNLPDVAGSPAWHLSVPLRKWQVEALQAWTAAGLRGMVSVVTGAGKTVFAEACLDAFRRQFPLGRSAVVVPTLALLDQWYVSLREDLGVSEADIGLFSGEGKAPSFRAVNLIVLNTAREVAPRLCDQGGAFLIVDEVHRAASPVNSLALAGSWQATLGMSATPEREYDSGFEDVLVPSLGPVVYSYDYRAAVADGVISRFSLVNVEIQLLPDERRSYDALSRRLVPLLHRLHKDEEVRPALKRLLQRRAAISASATLRIPAALRIAEQHRGLRTVIFHERIDAAETLLHDLESRGFNATIYHSRVGPVLRRDNLRLFRRGAFDVLVTCRALDEGVNVPETAIAIIASATASTRQRIQRMGRVLRPAPGKSHASIYTIYATDVERRRLEQEATSDTGAETVTWLRGTVSQHG